ncbi:hypothetical protein LUZ60_017762 [Juncus effusus]|nr:hypothetical protein LUZ60_017762 [Juncus effusus]
MTEDGSLDKTGNVAVKATTGGWRSATLLLVNYGLTTFAFFGVGVNLVVFLRRVLQQDNATAANNISKWTGTVYIFSLIGAFFSDSYWGRYVTCTIFQLIYLVGLTLLSITSWFLLVRPSGCGDGELLCNKPSSVGTTIFYLSIYLIAFGNGGYQPSIATFSSDQFDETDPNEKGSKISVFSYFYFALNAGSLFSNTILVYFEDSGKWVLGFWISTCSAGLGFLLFLIGTKSYRHFRTPGNPLTRIAQVLVASYKKRKVEVPTDEAILFEVNGGQSLISGRRILHSTGLRFLDRAAILTEENYCDPESTKNRWKLCTVTQVEEVKCVCRMIPIWLCTITYSVVFTQMASLFVEQGEMMDKKIGSFNIPPASMSLFDVLSVIVFICIYSRFLVPIVARVTKNPKGLTELQRMGIGLVIGMVAMVVAGLVELRRLKWVESSTNVGPSSLSILWQIPQYAMIGASEVFMYVGQLEFFNKQAPDGIKSFGSSLCMASISLGNYVSIILVSVVTSLTAGDKRPGWIPGNLNSGHLDRFYFLLATLSAIDLAVYLAFAVFFKGIRYEGVGEEKDKVVMMF